MKVSRTKHTQSNQKKKFNRKVFVFEVLAVVLYVCRSTNGKGKCIFARLYIENSYNKRDAKSAWNNSILNDFQRLECTWKSTVFYQTLHFKQANVRWWERALVLPIDTKQWPMTRYFRSHCHPFALPIIQLHILDFNAVLMMHFRQMHIKFHDVVRLPVPVACHTSNLVLIECFVWLTMDIIINWWAN